MAWTSGVTNANVRSEYPLLIAGLRGNTVVDADIEVAEDKIEALLRDKYDLTDPGTDKTVWRACLALALVIGLNATFASEGWTEEARTAVGLYYDEWKTFEDDIKNDRIKLSLTRSSTIQTPSVHSLDLGESDYSQFGLDGLGRKGFPLINEE